LRIQFPKLRSCAARASRLDIARVDIDRACACVVLATVRVYNVSGHVFFGNGIRYAADGTALEKLCTIGELIVSMRKRPVTAEHSADFSSPETH